MRIPRIVVASISTLLVLGCEDNSGLPDESYQFPTAIVGIPIGSEAEATAVRDAVKDVALQYQLTPYSRKDVPFFAERCRTDPLFDCPNEYLPPNPRMREGFSLTINEFSSRCFIIELSEYSGIWTQRSLHALQDLRARLTNVSGDTAKLLVRPKREQNWPMQKNVPDPERLNYLQEFCVRMGLPDPRQNPARPSSSH